MDKIDSLICVVDDDPSVREGLGSLIRSSGLRVETYHSAQAFLSRGRSEVPSCLVLDVHLPGLSGLELQQELARSDVQIPIVFLSGRGDIPMTVRAMKAGALEFLTKPFDDERLLNAVHQGVAWQQAARSVAGSAADRADKVLGKKSLFEEVIGSGPALKAALHRVSKVAPTDSTVLITGETGTGKELIARAIYKRSQRALGPFVSVNCAAIPQSLIASELFGHEKGAFTGAQQRRLGRFEMAQGGTLFLDEVGELPAETQIALLRVLQEREFERVGGQQSIRIDVRVIAATHQDLPTAIAAGAFRSDLYYRLNVFPIEIPPLRERKEDIPLLVEHFIHHYAKKAGKKIRGVHKIMLERLQSYFWPGNVRELQNVIERSVITSETETLMVDESWLSRKPIHLQAVQEPISGGWMSDEKKLIEAALAETYGRVSGLRGAALKLDLPASTLESKIRSLRINKHRFKAV
jgi:DNA-binding NtrC family response regulator